jgi:hypothetical protein
MLALAVAGCGSARLLHEPVPKNLVETAQVENLERVRFWGDSAPNFLSEERVQQIRAYYGAANLRGRHVEIETLSLSGGGGDGAFGAGLLVGWTESGRRPEFEVVTGISTGALRTPRTINESRFLRAAV